MITGGYQLLDLTGTYALSTDIFIATLADAYKKALKAVQNGNFLGVGGEVTLVSDGESFNGSISLQTVAANLTSSGISFKFTMLAENDSMSMIANITSEDVVTLIIDN